MVFSDEKQPNGVLNPSATNQNLKNDEAEKIWEHAWTTDEIRKNSNNWTLAGDVGLLNHLKQFSFDLISKTHEMEKVVDALVHKSKVASAKVNNVINDFQMLSNLQFVENRVYDEEATDPETTPNQEVPQKTKEEREAEMVPRITHALELGISVLDKAFERIDVDETSESEEDEESQGRTVLEPKDMYEHRPLPFIIGSKEFDSDDLAGLHFAFDEDVSTDLSTQDENISASAESESESEDESVGEILPPEPVVVQAHKETKSSIDTLQAKDSDSDSSDLFDDEPAENGHVSDPLTEEKPPQKVQNSLIEELKRKTRAATDQPDIPKQQSIPQPVVQSAVKKESEDLFTNSDSILDDEDDSPFRKKTGLFASDSLFGSAIEAENESSLFDEEENFSTSSKSKQRPTITKAPEVKAIPVAKEEPPAIKSDESDLFGDDGDDSENDLFSSIKVPKSKASKVIEKKAVVSAPVKSSKTNQKEAPAKTAPEKKPFSLLSEPSRSDSLFDDDSDDNDLFSSATKTKKNSFSFVSGINDENDDDLFSAKTTAKPAGKETVKTEPMTKTESSSLFEESDNFDLFGSKSTVKSSPVIDTFFESNKTPKVEPLEQASLFEESDSFDLLNPQPKPIKKPPVTEKAPQKPVKVPEKVLPEKKIVPSLFDDSDNSDLFGPPKDTVTKPPVVKEKEKVVAPIFAPSAVTQPKVTVDVDLSVHFDEPISETSTLSAINKDRIKGQPKRRKPTRKGRQSRLLAEPDVSDDIHADRLKDDVSDIFSSMKPTPSFESKTIAAAPPAETTKAPHTYKAKEQSKKNLMSQLMAEAKSSKIIKKGLFSDSNEDSGGDLFSSKMSGDKRLGSDFSFASPTSTETSKNFAKDNKKQPAAPNTLLSDSTSDDDLFSTPDFKSSLAGNSSMFAQEDEDDDIFKSSKTKYPSDKSSVDNILDAEDDDIFAGVDKEKYEMFPTQPFDDNDDDSDDIFSNLEKPSASKAPQEKAQAAKKNNKPDSNDLFSDPLGGLALND